MSTSNDSVLEQRTTTTCINVKSEKSLRRKFIRLVIVLSKPLIHTPTGLADILFPTRERNTINNKHLAVNKFVSMPFCAQHNSICSIIPYVHQLSHNLKKVAIRANIRVVFSVPDKLGKLCAM
uniref:Tick transposon n=1 Tax=Rhipicephalus zambeziensis TaxID=60191 RepID=A0A224YZU3_9ACAR